MDDSEISIMVTLDLSKCFDVVPHSKLLEKLLVRQLPARPHAAGSAEGKSGGVGTGRAAGARGGRAAGPPRGARPAGDYQLFNTRDINSDIFQGGALSCILYALYSNDLSSFIGDSVAKVCNADDSTQLTSGRKSDLRLVNSRMAAAVIYRYQWFSHNGMKVNAKKNTDGGHWYPGDAPQPASA